MIRTPIISFLGHVDAGKTTLQDFIRKTAVGKAEAGAITQSIGATIVPADTIRDLCGDLLEQLKIGLHVPGLLMIDTPGHAAFVSLRRRGGTLADIAILVVDINDGLMPQTIEAIQILKQFKTPFLVAVNKIDTLSGWRNNKCYLLENISKQQESIQKELDKKIYAIVGQLSEHGFNADRYDRVGDYTQQIALIPCSAKSGEGVPELLIMAAGLSQRFLGDALKFSIDAPAKGTILEVKRDKGLGTTLDVIIYDGVLKKGEEIVIGGTNGPITTRVKALLQPKPLTEMKDSRTKYLQQDEVVAATGVKISALNIDDAVAGMPLIAAAGNILKAQQAVQQEVSEMTITLDDSGIIVKADTLGSLEALTKLLRESNLKVKKAAIGDVTRKDVADAASNLESDPLNAVIIGFNVQPNLTTTNIPVLTDTVIYTLIEKLQKWQEQEKKQRETRSLSKLVKPCKLVLLKGYLFRQSNPAIVGSEVLLGTAQTGTSLMKNGKQITTIREIQDNKENVNEAIKGKQVAIAYEGVTMGRQLQEGDELYSFITEEQFRKMKELKKYLRDDEKQTLREIAIIMRKENPLWGV